MIAQIGTLEVVVVFILAAVMALVGMIPFWFICKKAGLSPWLSLIMIIPFGGLVLPFIVAFMDWPALRRDSSGQPQP